MARKSHNQKRVLFGLALAAIPLAVAGFAVAGYARRSADQDWRSIAGELESLALLEPVGGVEDKEEFFGLVFERRRTWSSPASRYSMWRRFIDHPVSLVQRNTLFTSDLEIKVKKAATGDWRQHVQRVASKYGVPIVVDSP